MFVELSKAIHDMLYKLASEEDICMINWEILALLENILVHFYKWIWVRPTLWLDINPHSVHLMEYYMCMTVI